MTRAAAIVLVSACALACGRAAAPVTPLAAPKAHEAPPRPAPASRSLSVTLGFGAQGLHVRVLATGAPEDLRAWTLGEDEPDRLEARDAADRPVTFRREGRRLVLESPAAVVTYDVRPREADEDARTTLIEAARFRAAGEKILAIPDAFDAAVVETTVTLDGRGIDAPVLASTFGVGNDRVSRTVRVAGAELRRVAFLGGGGGRAEFDAPEGHDEAAWIGYTAFDPRAVAAEVAGFRGLLHDYFKGNELEPSTLLLAVDARPRGRFRVLRRASGLLVALSGTDPFDASLRLAVAHELVHAWIGERIWLGDATPGREAESYWFHEGVARWVAREQLARAGLLSPEEYATEVNRLLGIVTTSRHATRSSAELVREGTTFGVVPLLVARGALFATIADAHVRGASRGARSFDDVLRALARQAEAKRGPLPEGALREALAAEIGEARARSGFDEVVAKGTTRRLPDDALGGCFEAREIVHQIHDPGFDVAASRTSKTVIGLDPRSAAAIAGLRPGDALVSIDVPEKKGEARLEVERDQKRIVVVYAPSSGSARGQAFSRRAAFRHDDEACRKLALRR
ncbi:MAG: hypothetical protein KF819_04635 [Labilithrix sp.]|nr:hypothetical protein [Labilithrix sp.]